MCNLADRARHTVVQRLDRGLQTLPHPLRAECNLDLDGPGGRYTRRLFEQRVRASVHEVAAAREEFGLDPYPTWVTGLQFFGSANLPPPAEAVNTSAFAFNPDRVWITVGPADVVVPGEVTRPGDLLERTYTNGFMTGRRAPGEAPVVCLQVNVGFVREPYICCK